jgi:NADH-quinone oxidoreductase subunit N
LIPLYVRFSPDGTQSPLNLAGINYSVEADPVLFFGTISGDVLTELFNVLLSSLLILVVWMSTAWSFTEDWGEYFALIFWATVGMMLLTASEELLTLFVTLETMTICLYLCTAFEKDKRRSAEGGLKYFVYGSVSSALFLFGLSLVYGLTGTTRFDAIHQALLPGHGPSAGLRGNVAGATAVLLMLVGFGFKVAAVPFHQWAPDAYEGAPAPVTAWVATGSKIASFVALVKVLLHALGPWSSVPGDITSPGWIMVVALLAAASMTYGNFAALAQKNFKRMLAYSSIAHAGYMLVGVAAAGVSWDRAEAAGSVLFYLVVYAYGNVGAFALAAWLARDKGSDEIEDLNGLGVRHPALATCVLLLMLSLIGMPPLGGFFGKLYMFMEALDESAARRGPDRMTMIWLVALGLLNSVVSAFYYVRVLKAMFLRPPTGTPLASPPSSVTASIVLATAVSLGFGLFPAPLITAMKTAAVQMLYSGGANTLEERPAVRNHTGPSGTDRPENPPSPSTSRDRPGAQANP